MINGWSDDFIPSEIRDNIIHLKEPDHREREGYTVNLEVGNYENDLHAAEDEGFNPDDHEALITGSVYTDVNGERQDPNVRVIDALLGVVTSNQRQPNNRPLTANDVTSERPHTQTNAPIISYAMRGQATVVNSWEDHQYFTGAFPTLFPGGIGGHLEQRTIPVSLEAFAEWALNHHSRRYVVFTKSCRAPLTVVDSHAIRRSCTFFMIACSSEVLLFRIRYSLSVRTGSQQRMI